MEGAVPTLREGVGEWVVPLVLIDTEPVVDAAGGVGDWLLGFGNGPGDGMNPPLRIGRGRLNATG